MGIRFASLLLIAALSAANVGCGRNCVPQSVVGSHALVDLNPQADPHFPVSPAATRELAEEIRRKAAGSPAAGARPYQFLALSGGGLYGSYGAGVLAGWTESGRRPQFDVVTGISTGALISTFAFLGPEYDRDIHENLVGVRRAEILRRRPLFYLPIADAFFTSRPMAKRIEEVLTPELVAEVGKAHATGRRLYIGTTNLDTRRLVIWDMGAIAAQGTPESIDLYRKVILASSSVPGAFPPVRIDIEIDGCKYQELHADGGVSDMVIFRTFMVAETNRRASIVSPWAPAGSTLYVIDNGKLYADPGCVSPHVVRVASAAFRSASYAKTRDELNRIYLNSLQTGVEFRLTAVPQYLRFHKSGALGLTRSDQSILYEEGMRIGREPGNSPGWRDLPPDSEPEEQILPRAGTHFTRTASSELP